ncbi:SCP2 sterol-binding domain-containing protein [Streptomyces sp. NPDC020607]|uniref:SCP2 sterol-binding domain-containing protein n=1 Tax=Streptomyces sp. NPDC020607 TaxID=3365082 RepID=UPI0037AD94A4
MADDISEITELDFAGVTPEEFARIVKGLSNKQFAELAEDGTLRGRILQEVFGRMERQFKPEAAASVTALIRWKITGSGGNEDVVYETDIADGTCVVRAGQSESKPRVTLILADAEFLKLVSGNVGPVALFMMRKVRVVGDVALAAGLTRYFDIPKV